MDNLGLSHMFHHISKDSWLDSCLVTWSDSLVPESLGSMLDYSSVELDFEKDFLSGSY